MELIGWSRPSNMTALSSAPGVIRQEHFDSFSLLWPFLLLYQELGLLGASDQSPTFPFPFPVFSFFRSGHPRKFPRHARWTVFRG